MYLEGSTNLSFVNCRNEKGRGLKTRGMTVATRTCRLPFLYVVEWTASFIGYVQDPSHKAGYTTGLYPE